MNELLKLLEKISLDVYKELGGLNFDEKDFQVALGYELTKKKIPYLMTWLLTNTQITRT